MSGSSGSGPLVPTFHGFVHNSMDGLLLFEACLSGKLHHVPRRPHDRERTNLIKSGSIFIYEENASGIKRWTDGVAWSPSRILGNFLIYRELEKPFPPGEKKRAMKRKRSSQISELSTRRESDDQDSNDVMMPPTPPSPKPPTQDGPLDPNAVDNDRELERQLIGSLVDSYGFRPDGLVKKTMSVAINGISHHLVSYYKVDDVKNKLLSRPINDARLQGMAIRPELYLKQNFRTPVEDSEHYFVDQRTMHAVPDPYSQGNSGAYGMRPGQYMPPPGYPMYNAPGSSVGMYGGPTTTWPSSQHPGPSSSYSNQSYPSQQYSDYYSRTASATPQSQAAKPEDGHAPGYSDQYSNPYQGVSRSQSSSYSSIPSHYQQPSMRPHSSQSYSQPHHSPAHTQTAPAPSSYPTASGAGHPAGYAVQSPPQYGQSSAALQHRQSIKSPTGTIPPIHSLGSQPQMSGNLPYRHTPYTGPQEGAAGEGTASISPNYQQGMQNPGPAYSSASYGSYGATSQYRGSAPDGATSVSSGGTY